MRYGVSHRWILVGLCVLSAGLLGWPAPTNAQILNTLTGTLTGTLGTTTVLGDTGTLSAGTVDALDNSADSISTSLLSAEAPDATVIGYVDQIDSDSSLASVAFTIAGITITADSATAEVLAPLTGLPGVGTSTISNLSINGVSVPVDGTVNQTIAIPGGQLVVNEHQVLSDGTTVVNALDATVNGVAKVVVASATAGASGGDAKAAQVTTF